MKTKDITRLKTALGVVMAAGLLNFSTQGLADVVKFPPHHLAKNFTETAAAKTVRVDPNLNSFYESFYAATIGDQIRLVPVQPRAAGAEPWRPKGLAAVWSYSRGPQHLQRLHEEYDQIKQQLGS